MSWFEAGLGKARHGLAGRGEAGHEQGKVQGLAGHEQGAAWRGQA